MNQVQQNNKALIRKLLDAADRGEAGALARFYATDYVDHHPSPGRATATGVEGVRRAFEMFSRAFPDTRHELRDLIAEGDRVVARTYAEATHTGEILGIAPTGKRVSLEAISIYRIAEGKIAERWCYQGRGVLDQLADAVEDGTGR